MKNLVDVLKAKELELLKVRREIEALRVALPLLGEDDEQLTPGRAIFGSAGGHKAVPLP